ncbi:MAG: hypothetical protein DGJ47_000210 [Rickettsiaceae bacterium]
MEAKKEQIVKYLNELEIEHAQLNNIIDQGFDSNKYTMFMYQKMKKRKLHLKDKIEYIRSKTYPDIIA